MAIGKKLKQRLVLIPSLTKKRASNYGISWITFRMYSFGIKDNLVVAM
jgi:hypothetical protein